MSTEVLTVSGIFGENTASSPSDELNISGDRRPDELRIVQHTLGTVILYGDCLADTQAIGQVTHTALSSGRAETLTTLPGSYTSIVLQHDKLTALSDLAGQYPLYFRRDKHGVAFSTATAPLRQGMTTSTLDAVTAAARIALPSPTELLTGHSTLEGISRLDAGHILRADRYGNSTTSPYETFQTPTITTIDEAVELLRSALQESAALRADSGYRLSADFSGGLDSTTAAFLTAQASANKLLIATRYTPGISNDDPVQVNRLLGLPASQGLFKPHMFATPTGAGSYANLLAAPRTDEPQINSSGYVRDRAYMQFLRAQGSELHLTGAGADCIFDLQPRLYLGGLWCVKAYGRFVRSAIEAGRAGLQSPWQLAQEAIANSKITPQAEMRMLCQILKGRNTPDVLRHGGWLFGEESAPQWLTPYARRLLIGAAEARAEAIITPEDFDYGNYTAYLALRDIAYNQHGVMRDAAQQGLRRRAFFFDNAILRATLGLPAHLRVNPWTFKAILAQATDGLIPPEVTSRSSKGNYTPHMMASLRDALPTLYELLNNSRLAEMGIIKPAAVRHTLDRIPMSSRIPIASIQQFAVIEQWLRNQDSTVSLGIPPAPQPPVMPTSAEISEPNVADDTTYHMPRDVHMITCATGAVALLPQGTYYRQNAHTLELIRALQAKHNFESTITRLQTLYPDEPPAVLRNSVSKLIRQLEAQGILQKGEGPFSLTEGTATGRYLSGTMTRQNNEKIPVKLRDYPIAIGGFALALVLKQLPFAQRINTLRAINRYWARRPSYEASGVRTLAAVQRVASVYVGKAACLEISTAAVLGEALKRRQMNLTIGVATDPDTFHAWPTINGTPIRTANDPEISGIFEPLLQT